MAGNVRLDSIDAILLKISKMQALTEKLKTDVEKFSACVDKAQASSEKMGSVLRQSVDDMRKWREEVEAEDAKAEASIEEPNQEIEEVPRELQNQFMSSEVNSYLPNPIVVDIAWKERDELVDASIGIRWTNFRMNSSYCLSFPSAHQVFVKMCAKDVSLTDGASEYVNGFSKISRDCLNFFVAYKIFAKIPRRDVWVFDPGIAEILVADSIDSIEIGIADFGETAYKLFDEMPSRGITVMGREYWKFDPGDVDSSKFAGFEQTGYQLWYIIFKFYDVLILVFDPGISEWVIFYQFSVQFPLNGESVRLMLLIFGFIGDWADWCLWCFPFAQRKVWVIAWLLGCSLGHLGAINLCLVVLNL